MELSAKRFHFTSFQGNANGNNEMDICLWMIPNIDRDRLGKTVVMSFSSTFRQIK